MLIAGWPAAPAHLAPFIHVPSVMIDWAQAHPAETQCPPCCRYTCENVVRVLRENKDSVMAMLEAFVHDPLINWRLLNTADPGVGEGSFIQEGSGQQQSCALSAGYPAAVLRALAPRAPQ